jgi:hypothetical protein
MPEHAAAPRRVDVGEDADDNERWWQQAQESTAAEQDSDNE